MPDADRDLVALFAEEPAPAMDPAFVARVAGEVTRVRRGRLWLMSAGGLALGLGAGLVLAVAAPVLGEAGRTLGEATRAPTAIWTVAGCAVAFGLAMPFLCPR